MTRAWVITLDELLHQVIGIGCTKKKIVDVLIDAHRAEGLDVQRAFVDDVVASAVDQINEAAAQARVDAERDIGDRPLQKTVRESEVRKTTTLTSDGQIGGAVTAPSNDAAAVAHLPVTTTDSGNNRQDDEALKHGAIRRAKDGRLVFATEEDAAEYQLETGQDCYFQQKATE